MILPILASAEVVSTHTNFIGSEVGASLHNGVVHIGSEQVGNRTEIFLGFFVLTPTEKVTIGKFGLIIVLCPKREGFHILSEVNILFLTEREEREAEGIYLVGTLHSSHKASVGRGVGVVGNHSMNDVGEVVTAIVAVVGEQRTDFVTARAGLDRRTLDTIEDTRVDVQTVRAVGVVEGNDDNILFFRVSRHSVFSFLMLV